MTAGFFPFSVMVICLQKYNDSRALFRRGDGLMARLLPPLAAIAKSYLSSRRAFSSSAAVGAMRKEDEHGKLP